MNNVIEKLISILKNIEKYSIIYLVMLVSSVYKFLKNTFVYNNLYSPLFAELEHSVTYTRAIFLHLEKRPFNKTEQVAGP